jgi:protein-S-isoprenylcysteine O-methyltransferase Ste14
MVTLIRHLIAIAALPFTVTVLIPMWISARTGVQLAVGATAVNAAIQAAGIAALVPGLLLFAVSLHYFATQGRGTLAPWDPPRHLVVEGPYRYVRNPMISSVLFILFGESLILLSGPHAQWALLFLCINLVYIPLVEEPMLQSRFGDAYGEYRRHVRMFLPRVRPWTGAKSSVEKETPE